VINMSTNQPLFGAKGSGAGFYLNGNLDEIRWTVGECHITGNYTPGEFPTS
jgi:hypothetical protein